MLSFEDDNLQMSIVLGFCHSKCIPFMFSENVRTTLGSVTKIVGWGSVRKVTSEASLLNA